MHSFDCRCVYTRCLTCNGKSRKGNGCWTPFVLEKVCAIGASRAVSPLFSAMKVVVVMPRLEKLAEKQSIFCEEGGQGQHGGGTFSKTRKRRRHAIDSMF